MSTQPADTPRLRASDAEREEFATIVREAVGEGRLDIAEGDTRLAAIYAARYRDELAPIVTDLPAGQSATRPGAGPDRSLPSGAGHWGQGPFGPGPGPWGQGPWGPGRGRMYRRGRYGGGLPGVFAHTGFVVIIAGLLTLLWVISAAHFFWPAIPLFFLVVGLGRHWRWATWRARASADDRT